MKRGVSLIVLFGSFFRWKKGGVVRGILRRGLAGVGPTQIGNTGCEIVKGEQLLWTFNHFAKFNLIQLQCILFVRNW